MVIAQSWRQRLLDQLLQTNQLQHLMQHAEGEHVVALAVETLIRRSQQAGTEAVEATKNRLTSWFTSVVTDASEPSPVNTGSNSDDVKQSDDPVRVLPTLVELDALDDTLKSILDEEAGKLHKVLVQKGDVGSDEILRANEQLSAGAQSAARDIATMKRTIGAELCLSWATQSAQVPATFSVFVHTHFNVNLAVLWCCSVWRQVCSRC